MLFIEHLRATAFDVIDASTNNTNYVFPPGQVPKFNKMAAIDTPATINFMVKTIEKH